MKFDQEKKQSILFYILEKIDQGDGTVSKTVAETFSINQNTVHSYINELLKNGIIERVKRGAYRLVKEKKVFYLTRDNGDLDSDTFAFHAFFEPYIKELSANIREIWAYTFSEMMNNVMDHSEAQNVELIIEQDYLNTTTMIVDDGIGIFEKIKTYFNLSSCDEAICELFKGKLTTDSKNHSGEGIFFSSKMMDDFFIVSSGKIFSNNKFDNSRVMDLSVNTKGTGVIMTLSNYTHKQTHEVFDLYADIDGGFTKTTLPLKNIFDASPVSRSQAKRVCNRLEKFEEVVIDFEDIEWMGQGFAHQLFVVFQNEHPEVRLVPIHMNESIGKMYRHVTD